MIQQISGYSLIEIMVSLLILAIGMLGAGKLLTIELQHIKQISSTYENLERAREHRIEK